MGIDVQRTLPYSRKASLKVRSLALEEARRIHDSASKGTFDSGRSSLGIEQEAFIVSRRHGIPCDVENTLIRGDSGLRLGIRPETAKHIIEYDSPITCISQSGIIDMLNSFIQKTKAIQEKLDEITGREAIVVCVGVQPFMMDDHRMHILNDPVRRKRYDLLNRATKRENPNARIRIRDQATGEEFTDMAINTAAHTRCAATQIHLMYPTIAETLHAYNSSIAIAGTISAIFANSPFAYLRNTGFASSRAEILDQAEQKRSGLSPAYVDSVIDYYKSLLEYRRPAIILDTKDCSKHLEIVHGTMHFTARIRIDQHENTSRIELRMLDSQWPRFAVAASLLALGAIHQMHDRDYPAYDSAKKLYDEGKRGLTGTIAVKAERLIEDAIKGLEDLGVGYLRRLLGPAIKMVEHRRTQADEIKERVIKYEDEGMNRGEALATTLRYLHDENMEA